MAKVRTFLPKARIYLSNRRVEQIINQTTPSSWKTGKLLAMYETSGGFAQASKHFDKITKGCKVVLKGNGLRTAVLPDGRRINVRAFSSHGSPTLEIQRNRRKTKIRYHELTRNN